MKFKLLLASLLTTMSLSALTVGEIPKSLRIEGENGGNVKDDSAWSSQSLQGKVTVLFYVDPDEKSVNEHFSKALHAKNYRDKGAFESVAIINLAATWKPNFVIEKILSAKQKDFKKTTYVKDKSSVLVKEWGMDDDASDITLFNKEGRVLFYKSGKMSEADIEKIYSLIEENL